MQIHKKTLKIARIALLAAMTIIMPPAPVFAEDYYIELGTDAGDMDAKKTWDELVGQHKQLLGGLSFYPKEVIQAGTTVGTRIQAGPIADKAKAQAVCKRLFAKKVPCFVMEGLSIAPGMVMNLTEKASEKPVTVTPLPWITEVPPPGPDTTSEISQLPIAETPAANPEANVEVAEAIRVPLSNSEQLPQTVEAVPAAQAAELPPPVETVLPSVPVVETPPPPPPVVKEIPGWLTVEAFASEDKASSFWQEVHTAAPEKTAPLEVKIVKPLVARGQPMASLIIGPFAGSKEAYDFCRDSIQAKDSGLLCRFEGDAAAAPVDPIVSQPVVLQSAADQPVAAQPAVMYWVQLISAPNQKEAMRQWELVRTGNQDILAGMHGSISAWPDDPNNYVVRVGPIDGQVNAAALCGQLRSRGINCRVLAKAAK